MKKNIIVLCGGKSVEHEVSLKSSTAIINSINRDKFNVYPVFIDHKGVFIWRGLWEKEIKDPSELSASSDLSVAQSMAHFLTELDKIEDKIIFPALHGQNGEDGTMQGFLEILNLPYVGSGVLASSMAMDKGTSRDIFAIKGLPQTEYVYFLEHEWIENKEDLKEEFRKIGYPVYVKPANLGSSVGISRVENEASIDEAIDFAFKYDIKVIVEKELIAREMQVSVIGNDHPEVSLPGEFIMERAFFDYDAKYLDNSITPVVPANLTDDTTKRVRQLAVDSYKALNCTGLTRVDIFVDKDNNIFVNEANTMPGFTPVSMTPVLWKATDGTTYTDLVEKLIEFGFDRYEKRQKETKYSK